MSSLTLCVPSLMSRENTGQDPCIVRGVRQLLLLSLGLPLDSRFSLLSFWRVKSWMRIFNGRGLLPLTPELFQGQLSHAANGFESRSVLAPWKL